MGHDSLADKNPEMQDLQMDSGMDRAHENERLASAVARDFRDVHEETEQPNAEIEVDDVLKKVLQENAESKESPMQGIALETPAGKMLAKYDASDDVFEFLPAEVPELVDQTAHNQGHFSLQGSVSKLDQNDNQVFLKFPVYVIPVHGRIQFRSAYFLESNYIRKFIHSNIFLGLISTYGLIYMAAVEILRLPDRYGWYISAPMLLYGAVLLSLFLFQIEKHLFRMLLKQFNFWFLMLYTIIFSLSFLFISNRSIPQKVLQTMTVFTVHVLVVLFDAVPKALAKLKIFGVTVLIAYGGWTLIRGAYEIDKFAGGAQWCWIYCADISKFRLGAYSNVCFFYAKFLNELFRHPRNKIILSSPMNYILGIYTKEESPVTIMNSLSARMISFLGNTKKSTVTLQISPVSDRQGKTESQGDVELGEKMFSSNSQLPASGSSENLERKFSKHGTNTGVDAKLTRPLSRGIPFANLVVGNDRSYHIRPFHSIRSFLYTPLIPVEWMNRVMLTPYPATIACVAAVIMVVALPSGKLNNPLSLFLSIPIIMITLLFASQVDRNTLRLLLQEFDFWFMVYNLLIAAIFGIIDNQLSGLEELGNKWRNASGYSVFIIGNLLTFLVDGIPSVPRWIRTSLWFLIAADHLRVLLNSRLLRNEPINGMYCVLYCAAPANLANTARTVLLLYCLKSSLAIARFPRRYTILKSPMTTSLILSKKDTLKIIQRTPITSVSMPLPSSTVFCKK